MFSETIHAQEIYARVDETDDPGNFTEDYPVELNRATRKQLELCKCLSAEQVLYTLEHIRVYGGFISRYELQVIPGVEDIHQLLKYFSIDELPVTAPPPAPVQPQIAGVVLIQSRWRNHTGFQYRGRLDFTGKRDFLGIRFERDEGEPWQWEPKRNLWGIDHLTLTYQRKFNNWALTVGEFGIHAGMGLVFNAGFFLGKGSSAPLPAATAYVRSGPSFRENETQHGISLEANKNQWKVIAALTRSANDANIYDDGSFRSLSNSGWHREERERDKQNRVIHYGLHNILQYTGPNGYFGTAFNTSLFNHRFYAPAQYQVPLPSGKLFAQASLFGFLRKKRSALWGELAISDTRALSMIAGMSQTFGRNSSLIWSLRKYSPGYLSFWGKSMSESSNGHRNENGFYTAFISERRKRFRLYSFLDIYRIPEESYRHQARLLGVEFRTTYTRWIQRRHELRWTTRLEWRNQQPGNPLRNMLTHKQQVLLYFVVPSGRLMFRLQYNGRVNTQYESGYLTAMEKRFELNNTSISIFAAHFKTSSYYTREFVYERDVWGSFSLPSYFHGGFRTMIFCRWRHENTTLWIRAGLTHVLGKPAKGEVKFQVKYQI